MKERASKGGIYVKKRLVAERLYVHHKHLHLFPLFMNSEFLEYVRIWTFREMKSTGMRRSTLRMGELKASVRLKLVKSVVKLNRLKDLWSTFRKLRNYLFKSTLSSDIIIKIRMSLRFYALYEPEIALDHLLWHCRHILEHLMLNAATVAVPMSVSFPDVNTVSCNELPALRTFMKSEHVKYGIRF